MFLATLCCQDRILCAVKREKPPDFQGLFHLQNLFGPRWQRFYICEALILVDNPSTASWECKTGSHFLSNMCTSVWVQRLKMQLWRGSPPVTWQQRGSPRSWPSPLLFLSSVPTLPLSPLLRGGRGCRFGSQAPADRSFNGHLARALDAEPRG